MRPAKLTVPCQILSSISCDPLAMANIVLNIVALYLLVGLLFAIPFVVKGAGAIDPVARGGSWGFRVIIVPGVLVFWPLLAKPEISPGSS